MAHHHSCDGDHLAGSATQIQTVYLQIPEQRNSKRRSHDQTGDAKPAASVRISLITWAGRIPTAISMPNSRVRSNTAMSIVFMTPMTATRKKMKKRTTVTP